ncbi:MULTISPECIES: hypothetical protein [unclassified Streptomyces]|uniref:hypothetical protein n=1 Tax=unclassified Streptomyces TaxID=2593676 RepID=UPI00131B4586|nr:hypothetical protein [Streptomyces sp. CB01201]MBX7464994.1 hypothetical protein [Streptomyces sp. MAG02]
MSQTQTPSAYVTPECREARNLFWRGGHLLCPGPLEVRQPPGAVAIETLRCACSCHETDR